MSCCFRLEVTDLRSGRAPVPAALGPRFHAAPLTRGMPELQICVPRGRKHPDQSGEDAVHCTAPSQKRDNEHLKKPPETLQCRIAFKCVPLCSNLGTLKFLPPFFVGDLAEFGGVSPRVFQCSVLTATPAPPPWPPDMVLTFITESSTVAASPGRGMSTG